MRVSYAEYATADVLRPYVACYWSLDVDDAPADGLPTRILPDGCVDILFGVSGASPGLVVGYMTGETVGRIRGPARSVCVRFRPGAAPVFFGCPASRLTDESLPLDDLWSAAAHRIADRVRSEATTAARIDAIEDVLLRRLQQVSADADVLVRSCVAEMVASPGGVRVGALADLAGMTARHLSRRFLDAVGVSTKAFARSVRFHAAVGRIGPGSRLPEVAYDTGFSDQAHLNREFKQMAGLTPTEYIASLAPDAACPILSIPRSAYLV